jgi:hypothetical protein
MTTPILLLAIVSESSIATVKAILIYLYYLEDYQKLISLHIRKLQIVFYYLILIHINNVDYV